MGNRRWSLLREAIRGQNSGVASPVLAESHLVALLQLQQAWGAWAGNSNASTVCSAWAGVTCSPKGLVVALDTRALPIDPPPSGSIPASITNLATLQYLDLSYVDLEGPIPSLASLTRLTHLYVPFPWVSINTLSTVCLSPIARLPPLGPTTPDIQPNPTPQVTPLPSILPIPYTLAHFTRSPFPQSTLQASSYLPEYAHSLPLCMLTRSPLSVRLPPTTSGLLDLSRFTGDLSFLAILSRLESLQDL
ncbi:unnamed protein product [Closterium sp. NIES-65]|nr:unnamed protein product [Closterium sp. NIES-65]